jgi:hypothetical protein
MHRGINDTDIGDGPLATVDHETVDHFPSNPPPPPQMMMISCHFQIQMVVMNMSQSPISLSCYQPPSTHSSIYRG